MKKSALAVGFAMSIQCGAVHANTEKPTDQKEAISKNTGSIGDLFRFFKNPRDESPVISAIKASVASLPKEQLVASYRESVYAHPVMLDAITRIYVGRDASQAEAFIEQLITAARDEKFSDEWRKIKQEDDVAEIITRLVSIVDPEIQMAAFLKELKAKPEKMAILLVGFAASTAGSQVPSTIAANVRETFIDTYKTGFPVAALGLLALAGVGGGGGGGGSGSVAVTCGGGPCSPIYSESSFQTTEYNNQAGLGLVKAAGLYSYGGTGSGITVAVFDSGILASHSEFTGRVLTGYDYVANSSGVSVDPNGHGTHVSGIIAAGRGAGNMHGVAYGASILPIRIADAAGSITVSDATLATALNFSRSAGAGINNHSWGSSTAITSITALQINTNLPQTLAALRASAAAGVVQVWAAGNDGRVQPSYQAGLPYHFSDLQSTWLAVMAVDLTGSEPLYSNRCGVAAAWCLAAPGGSDTASTGGVYSTTNDGSYGRMSGTSMAAPHVAGALAALKSRFPSLSYIQIRDRLLATANRIGVYSNSAIFGQGLMDLSAAASPVGVLSIPTGSNINGSSFQIKESLLQFPASLRTGLLAAMPSEILLVDSFQNAPFKIDINKLIKASNSESVRMSKDLLFSEQMFISKKGDYSFSKDGNQSLFGQISAGPASSKNWHFGTDSSNSLTQNLGFSGKIPTQSESSIIGFSTGFDDNNAGPFRVGAWTNTQRKVNNSPAITLSNNVNTALPIMLQGVAASKSWNLSSDYALDVGVASGPTTGFAKSVVSDGAFAVGKNSIAVNWVGINKSLKHTQSGGYEISLIGQQSHIRSDAVNSLMSLPDSIRLLDLVAAVNWTSDNGKNKLKASFGKTTTIGAPQLSLKIPSTVDESGALTHKNANVGLNSVYDQKRTSIQFSRSISKSTEFRLIMDVLSQQTTNSMLGVGLNIKWN